MKPSNQPSTTSRLQGVLKTTRFNTIIMALMAVGLAAGYSHQSYAGNCSAVAAGVSTCSGAANTGTDSTQTLNSGTSSLTVTTVSGFGLNATGTALSLKATGGINFSHMSGGALLAPVSALMPQMAT